MLAYNVSEPEPVSGTERRHLIIDNSLYVIRKFQ